MNAAANANTWLGNDDCVDCESSASDSGNQTPVNFSEPEIKVGTGFSVFEIPEINFNPVVNAADPYLEVGAFNAPVFEIQPITFTPIVNFEEGPLEVGARSQEVNRQPSSYLANQ